MTDSARWKNICSFLKCMQFLANKFQVFAHRALHTAFANRTVMQIKLTTAALARAKSDSQTPKKVQAESFENRRSAFESATEDEVRGSFEGEQSERTEEQQLKRDRDRLQQVEKKKSQRAGQSLKHF